MSTYRADELWSVAGWAQGAGAMDCSIDDLIERMEYMRESQEMDPVEAAAIADHLRWVQLWQPLIETIKVTVLDLRG